MQRASYHWSPYVTFPAFQVVAPTIKEPACQEQLVEAAKHVAKNVDNVVDTAQV